MRRYTFVANVSGVAAYTTGDFFCLMVMTANKRIFLNVVATYGRSLYALFCGLFTIRWVLQALGPVDYGLYGVVACLTGFISFINSVLSQAVGRFYAFSVGNALVATDYEQGIEESKKWFNVAVAIHTVVPAILIAIGYPVGMWAVKNFLTIPPDRVQTCAWIFRFSCITCFLGMSSVPYRALYSAHQDIAELTLYSFVTTTLNTVFFGYMAAHHDNWLLRYSIWMCLMANIPLLLITIRSFVKYDEARFVPIYMRDWSRIKEVLVFASGRLVVTIAFMLNNNGVSVLVNKVLGPIRNAAMSVGQSISCQCLTLTDAMTGALQPAITNAAGERDYNKMRELAFAACKFTTIAVLVFAIPLSLEIKQVLILWLKNPPDLVAPLTICLLGAAICDQLSNGHWIAILAIGRVNLFSIVESLVWFLVLPSCVVAVWLGFDIVGVGVVFVLSKFLAIGVKLYFGKKVANLSIRLWLKGIFVPISLSTFIGLCSGMLVIIFLPSGFFRLVLTTIVCESVFLPLVYVGCLSANEKELIRYKFLSVFKSTSKERIS